MQNLGTYLNFPPHIAYSLWHFYWAPMKNKGVYSWDPQCWTRNRAKIFKSRPKLGKCRRFWGSGGLKKLRFLLQKAHVCMNPRCVSHFASKSVEGCDLQVGWRKNKESHRNSHRRDMSPLTQGLNYRSACDGQPIGSRTRATQGTHRRPHATTHSSQTGGWQPPVKCCIANCGQTVPDTRVVCIDIL